MTFDCQRGPRPLTGPARMPWLALAALPLALLATQPAAAVTPVTPPHGSGNTKPMPPELRIAPPLPPIRIVSPEARQPIELRRVVVRTEIAGRVASTHVELELYNPNGRVLQGELQFPLADGQAVAGFALDINGEMRPAVPVEKARGQQVFEDVIRARIDPALLEATQGNNYKLRVYPLPAGGTRRVSLDIEEALSPAAAADATPAPRRGGPPASTALAWRLPLRFGGAVGRLDLAVHVAGTAPLSAQLGAQALPVQRGRDGGSTLALARDNYRGEDTLALALPTTPVPLLLSTQVFDDRTYFYAEVQQPERSAPRPRPATIGLVWDASASGAQRDHGREMALLQQYLQALGTVRVQLSVVRDTAEATETFEVSGGDWRQLRQRLEGLAYDGATNLAAMRPPAGSALALLFSDGLGNYGGGTLAVPDVPLFTANAAGSGDATLLRRVAERSGGAYLDLAAVSPATALQALTTRQTVLAGLRASGARDLESASAQVQDGRLVLAGVLTEPEAELTLDLVGPDGQPFSRTLRLKPGPAPAAFATADGPAPGVAARRWAALRLASLQADAERNRAAIRRLGLAFGMVGPETSLIVLDNVADYARYDIAPPPSLRAAWQDLVARKGMADAVDQARHIERIVTQFQAKQAWWGKDFPKEAPPPPARPPADPRDGERRRDAPRGELAPAMPAPPAAMAPAPLAASRMAESAAAKSSPGGADAAGAAPAAIQLRKWQPDEPYARRLREARAEELYALYLDERPGYANSTAFFLDAADILFERGQPALAARVLSNLAEMNLENRQVLRILAYRLLQAGLVQEAVPVLEKVLRLSPEEPQSYRDLGLALARAGQPQRGIDLLWQVVSRPWNGRFPGVELIALAELNATVAAHPGLDTSRMDKRLLRNLPLDLRAVLAWDADDTDIDLWVTDPNGDKAYYGRPLTYQGGRMSPDFTGGYGPEEFSLRKARPGKYTVQAQFYGHRQQIVAPATTLMLRLTTGFGTPAQQDQDVVLRLKGQGQQVTVGEFEIGGGKAP